MWKVVWPESAGNNAGNKMGKQTWQTSWAKKKANKSWQTLGNPFLEVLPKPSVIYYKKGPGKQSHKGGCLEEAQILFNETVLGSSLSVQLVSGLLKPSAFYFQRRGLILSSPQLKG